MTRPNQGLSLLAPGGGKMRDPGKEVAPVHILVVRVLLVRVLSVHVLVVLVLLVRVLSVHVLVVHVLLVGV